MQTCEAQFGQERKFEPDLEFTDKRSLDYPVGAQQDELQNLQAKRLDSLHMDHQLAFCRPL